MDRSLQHFVLQSDFYVDTNTNNIKVENFWTRICTPVCRCDRNFNYLLKVSKFQNKFMKSSFLQKYEPKIVRISALHITGQKSLIIIYGSYCGRYIRWLHKFILKFTVHHICCTRITLLIMQWLWRYMTQIIYWELKEIIFLFGNFQIFRLIEKMFDVVVIQFWTNKQLSR